MSVDRLCRRARELTAAGGGGKAGAARRAFELAHRARRLLELGSETASRERWTVLAATQLRADKVPLVENFAGEVGRAVIKQTVHGEAAVYAAILDAVDLATAVGERLYREWIATQADSDPVPPPAGVDRLGAPMAAGCSRTEKRGPIDED